MRERPDPLEKRFEGVSTRLQTRRHSTARTAATRPSKVDAARLLAPRVSRGERRRRIRWPVREQSRKRSAAGLRAHSLMANTLSIFV